MKKQFLNLGKALNRAEQKEIFGGLKDPLNELAGDGGGGGGCMVGCRNTDVNGDHILITSAPDCTEATMDWACQNQGGANTCTC